MAMLPRLRPRCFYDLVIEVAIVRPGPIQGKMVHPYLRRRNGEEEVVFPQHDHGAVKKVLAKTLGVPLFQEQAMQLAIVAAGFTPDEADQLRRAMAAWKRKGDLLFRFGDKLIAGMVARGYGRDFAERCFEQIKGFSEYGFPESHAASFALLVYVSAWLKVHHPAAFTAALINSLPMGFYAPAQLVRDAQEHDIEVRPVDVNFSEWDCTLEEGAEVPRCRGVEKGESGDCPSSLGTSTPRHLDTSPPAVRLGTRLVRSLSEPEADKIAAAVRCRGPFGTIEDLWRASGVRIASLRHLAAADAFNSMGLDRQAALWQIRALRDDELPIFDAVASPSRSETQLCNEASSTEPSPEGAKARSQGRQPLESRAKPRSVSSHPSPIVANDHPDVAIAPADSGAANSAAINPEPAPSGPHPDIPPLPPIPAPRKVAHDYASTGLSLKAHPVSFIRDDLAAAGAVPAGDLADPTLTPNAKPVAVGGIVLVRQRPATASGILYITTEDETGIANLIIRPHIYERYRKAARHSIAILARGKVERVGSVVHIMVSRIESMDGAIQSLDATSRDFR